MRTLVTGGDGFLGSHRVERLQAVEIESFVARRWDYELMRRTDVQRPGEARPKLALQFAAEVGSIATNRASHSRNW